MFEVEIDRENCRSCGVCTKTSQILYLDSDNLVNMQGGVINGNIVEGFISNLYEIETSASICPEDCFCVYNDDTDEEVKIERHAKI